MCFFANFKIKRLTKKIKSLKQTRVHNQPSEEMVKKEKEYCHQLAKLYLSLDGRKKFPFAREKAFECYRAACELEDTKAQYLLGKALLEQGKFRQTLEEEGVFSSASNARQAQQLFEEALAYLQAAEKLNHIEAKRLYGLCYINGWGVTADKKRGFQYIMDSIDQENSWDRVPQIFASMGLNKPEFFSELAQHRTDTKSIS